MQIYTYIYILRYPVCIFLFTRLHYFALIDLNINKSSIINSCNKSFLCMQNIKQDKVVRNVASICILPGNLKNVLL